MSGPMCPDCGGNTVPALRYEAAGTVSVRACFGCGWESPQLYRRTLTQRNTGPYLQINDCRTCGAQMPVSRPSLVRVYCSRACSDQSMAGMRLDRATMKYGKVSKPW